MTTGVNLAKWNAGLDESSERTLKTVAGGDIIIAHMNKPASDTAEGLSEGVQRLQVLGQDAQRPRHARAQGRTAMPSSRAMVPP